MQQIVSNGIVLKVDPLQYTKEDSTTPSHLKEQPGASQQPRSEEYTLDRA